MTVEPVTSQACYLVKHPRLIEEVRRTWNDHELLLAAELRQGGPVELDYLDVVPANDKQRRCPNVCQSAARQIGTTSSRDHCAHLLRPLGGRHQRGGSAGAGTKVSDPEVLRVGISRKPIGRARE